LVATALSHHKIAKFVRNPGRTQAAPRPRCTAPKGTHHRSGERSLLPRKLTLVINETQMCFFLGIGRGRLRQNAQPGVCGCAKGSTVGRNGRVKYSFHRAKHAKHLRHSAGEFSHREGGNGIREARSQSLFALQHCWVLIRNRLTEIEDTTRGREQSSHRERILSRRVLGALRGLGEVDGNQSPAREAREAREALGAEGTGLPVGYAGTRPGPPWRAA
jgi:hypothetical protein